MRLLEYMRRIVLGYLLCTLSVAAADFTVSNDSAQDYVINGVNDPPLHLVRGQTYSFDIAADGHPFWIKTSTVTGTGSVYTNGVVGNGTEVGPLSFTVALDAPDTLVYICQFHFNMRGTVFITDPPAEPAWVGNPRMDETGAFAFDVAGTPSQPHSTEANSKPDVGWSVIGANNAPPSGTFTFTDTNASTVTTRFYRVATD